VTQIALVRAVPSEVAQQCLNHAEVLSTDLPETLHALTGGTVDPSHVAVIAEQVLRIVPRPIPVPESKDPAAREEWMRRVDAEERAVHAGRNELGGRLLDYAAGRSPASVRQKGKALLEKYDPVSFGKRSKKAKDDRWVRVEPGNNGMAYLTAALTSATAEAIYDRLDRQAKILKDTPADPDGTPEERTLDQLRTDALTDQLLAG
ncbi:DUF222 domain-containing protein, partial [Arthrobacter sp. KK5.5]|uniref:DUF222 domain-containing protein n=1 Tax=Arthrobacter sp. KK5.5 TaxID=3373084 RepID=UPI003EE7BDB1